LACRLPLKLDVIIGNGMDEKLKSLQNFLVDMDGVLWRGDMPLPGAARFFDVLRRKQLGYTLVTNNASRTVQQYVTKLERMGLAIEPERILTSAIATAEWLRAELPPGVPIHVVGMDGLRSALQQAGFLLSDGEEATAVVVGLDLEFDYARLDRAARLVRGGALFVGTNPDRTYPTPGGEALGAGSMLAAIEAASGQSPIIIGKPERPLFEQALKRLGAEPATSAMVGDRLETDIVGAKLAGLRTILVLSGVTQPDDIKSAEVQPDWVFENIGSLAEALEAAH
jgi:4-nitrophenyl phosphatase